MFCIVTYGKIFAEVIYLDHIFSGKWITNSEFSSLIPRNVFHRQLEKPFIDCSTHRNRHILFRKKFSLGSFKKVKIFISADDYYKLYINGRFAGQGPAPSYHFQYNYNEIDITEYLSEGENTIAVHTLYQGLINRVWQSGDLRHGLICDIVQDGKTVLSSNEDFLVAAHSGFSETGTCGYDTQFLECTDSSAVEVGFEKPDYDDSLWENASPCLYDDHILTPQKSHSLVFENILPKETKTEKTRVFLDFGATYVGYLSVEAMGNVGDEVIVRCAQELNDDGSLRYNLRANCVYEEKWVLSSKKDVLDWFDYKAFRYAELIFPESVSITSPVLVARHYPFTLKARPKEEYLENEDMMRIWELCVNTQRYGVQEVIQDCMEREKGFYVGDGCYTALTHMILTDDDSMVRKLIDDAFSSSFITPTLVTCLDCSFMQEIAEYPLMLLFLVLWHYNYTGDEEYLARNYPKSVALLEAFRAEYEKNGLLRELDKWCVVEWPMNCRHGYDVSITEGQVCKDAHVSINAYYIAAIRTVNYMARLLKKEPYRDESPVLEAFYNTFYDKERKLFKDGENTDHISFTGNSFVYGFGLYPDEETRQNLLKMINTHTIKSLSFFCTFPIMMGLVRDGDEERLCASLLNNDTWKYILRQGGTTTFEGWYKEMKWNTSLFHMTMSYGALFIADIDLKSILQVNL